MDDLEKYIRENSSKFQFEPAEGHFDRFKSKLKKTGARSRTVSLFTGLLKAAAVAVLLVISSLWTFEKIANRNMSEGLSLGDISPEYHEVEEYYIHQVSSTCRQMKQTDMFSDEKQQNMVLQELSDMDSIYNCLKKDLKTNPDDERIINAMIGHYQMKLEIMNNILGQLHEINENYKHTNHENNEI